MRDFVSDPAWKESDLGEPLPDSPHACSVCLPTWNSVVGYEEGRDKVMRKLRAGYPRFFRHPLVAGATARAAKELCGEGEELFLFPTRRAVQRAHRWVERRAGAAARSESFEGIHALMVPSKVASSAIDYQRFTGEMISSRMAEDLQGGGIRTESKAHLVERRIANIYGAKDSGVSVFSCGMSAVTAVLRSLPGVADGKKTLQLEFPYVDSLKVQESIGSGVVFLSEARGEALAEALRRIRTGEFAAVMIEVPSNPLLRCPDLPKLAAACHEGGVPLVVDDSTVGPANVRVLPWADVVTCSLTKWMSGGGDVMGGASVVREDSKFAGELSAALKEESRETAPLYVGDVEVMLSNMKGFQARMERPNENGLKLAEYLGAHPAVESVWHPSREDREFYEAIMAPGGGYGPLLSFTLKAVRKTPRVFDALAVSKGPSFGTRFTLACPYMLLAHYRELEWAEACGVPGNLIRVSCGEEEWSTLEEAFSSALREA